MASSSFIPERPLLFSPTLAATLGLEETILLQYLGGLFEEHSTQHSQPPQDRRAGCEWMRVEWDWLLRNLPFWSGEDLRRLTDSLADKGVILVDSPPPPADDALVFALTPPGYSRTEDPGQNAGGGHGAVSTAAAWVPGEDLLNWLDMNHGISREFALEQLEDFVLYWGEREKAGRERSHDQSQGQSQGTESRHTDTHQGWQNRFRQHVLSRWRQREQAEAEAGRFSPLETSIAGDWRPSADALEILDNAGVDREFVEGAIAEFLLYWREKNPAEKALSARFVRHVRRQWEHYRVHGRHEGDPHPMTADWQPAADVFDALGLCRIDAQFARDLLPKFIEYWRGSGRLCGSWDTRFIEHVKYQWDRHHGLNPHETRRGTGATGGTRGRSLESDLTDRGWAHG